MEPLCLWLYLCIYILISLLQYPTAFSFINNNNNNNNNNMSMNHLCRQDERQLLLQLKLQLPPVAAEYLNESRDCCQWDGVTCDDFTGHVISLDLSSNDVTGELKSSSSGSLIGNLTSNSSLFHLTHLRKLNLAYNDFQGYTVPSEFGRLNALTHLNLSYANFGGEIPMEFYHLSNLLTLDLSTTNPRFTPYTYRIMCDVKMLFGNMTRLRVLLLPNQDLSNSELPMNMSSFLTHLDLANTGVQGNLPATLFEKPNLQILRFGNDVLKGSLKGSLPKSLNWSNVHSIKILDLSGTGITGRLPDSVGLMTNLNYLDLSETSISGALPDSIGLMTNLNYMDLANCRFSGPIPESIGNITAITLMHLSNNEFSGSLPSTISNLRHLFDLVLSYNHLEGQLPDAFSGLQNLTHMDLSYNNLEGRIPSSLTNMSQLEDLDISSNTLTGPFPSRASHGLQRLWRMDFSKNLIQGTIPPWLFSLPSLDSLDLSSNRLTGQMGKLNSQTLASLDLSSNRLTGQIGKLNSQTLAMLDLSSNRLNIQLESFYNLTGILQLKISNNIVTKLDGDIANVTFSHLNHFEMSSCEIKEFPNFLRSNMHSLEYLDLSYNMFTGQIGKLNFQTLKLLDLSSNRLNIQFESFYNLTNIEVLKISYNIVTENGGDVVNVTLGGLESLEMSYCEIKELPNFLQSSIRLVYLDLSKNNIQSWLTLNSLQPWERLFYLNLHSNSLQGTFPSFICNMTLLYQLDLSDNKLTGNIPECFLAFEVLDLWRNEFHGKIPAIGSIEFPILFNLGLNGNNLEGPLPMSLANCTMLEVIDLGNNMIQDTFPWWLHTLPELKILILKSNNFHGTITSPSFTNNSFTNLQILDLSYNNFTGLLPEKIFTSLKAIKNSSQASQRGEGLYMGDANYRYSVTLSVKISYMEITKVLKFFTTIDLSSNNFSGSIPESLSNLILLRLLNLSHNKLHGSIPTTLGRMTNLEQLDLSSNQLMGGIPQSLTNLTFLGDLDLSNNHLIGPIPVGNQFPTFSNESYVGNSGLCGAPLTRSCGDGREPSSEGDFEEEEDGFMLGFTWKVVVMGYGCGIVLGFTLGYVMISMERPRWLARFVYVEATIILRRRNKIHRVVQGRL